MLQYHDTHVQRCRAFHSIAHDDNIAEETLTSDDICDIEPVSPLNLLYGNTASTTTTTTCKEDADSDDDDDDVDVEGDDDWVVYSTRPQAKSLPDSSAALPSSGSTGVSCDTDDIDTLTMMSS